MTESEPKKQTWLKLYSVVLIANAIYLLAFYMISKAF